MDPMTQQAELSVAIPSGLDVRRVVASTGMSRLFEVAIEAVSTADDLDLDAIVDGEATLRVTGLEGIAARAWSGLIASMRQGRYVEGPEARSTYHLVLVPKLWVATQRLNRRHFQHQSIPTIVRTLLGEWEISAEWRIDEKLYPKLELRTQHEETDFDFMSRLLEEAGISFFFEHDHGHDSTLVLSDRPQEAAVRPTPLHYRDQIEHVVRGKVHYATKMDVEHLVRPGRFTMRDYDFRRPRFGLIAEAPPAEGNEARYEQYHFEPGAFLAEEANGDDTPVADDLGTARFAEGRGRQLATQRLEALRGPRRMVRFETGSVDITAGMVVQILDHPRTDRGLLVLEDHLDLVVGDEWVHRVESVYVDVPYRPARKTPKPTVRGTQSAVVVGPEDEEIYVDEFGRVRVQFQWDRDGAYDPHSSMWLRVSQGWAGTGWGMMNIPRIGQEVLVDYLEGDVDRPIVVGRVYNALQRVPYALPENKTVSAWRTDSTPGGDGSNYNEIKFEDKRERELFFIQAERDRAKLVKRDETMLVGRDQTEVVQRDAILAVQSNRTKVVHVDESVAVGQDRTAQVRRDESTAVGRDQSTVVVRDRTDTVGHSQVTTVGVDRTNRIGTQERSFIGSRIAWTIAPGLAESLAQGMGDVLDGPAGEMLGPVAPRLRQAAASVLESDALKSLSELLGATSRGETPIARWLQRPLEVLDPFMPQALSQVLALAASPSRRLRGDGGTPATSASSLPPTEIEMVNRKIRLSTGQATITLDGPDVRIEADRNITLIANQQVKVRSVGDDLVLRGGPMVLLNPESGDADRPHRDRKGFPAVQLPAAPVAGRSPNPQQLAAIGQALGANQHDMAVDLVADAYDLDLTPVVDVAYEPSSQARAMAGFDGRVALGGDAFQSAAHLASALLFGGAQAALAAALRRESYGGWPEGTGGEDAQLAADAWAYQAEVDAAPMTGLEAYREEVAHAERLVADAKASMTPEGRAAFEAGELPT